MRALLLIDIQNDFLPGGALAVPHGHQIIPVVNQLQPHFDLVVATQDWHPAHHKSFASQHPGESVFSSIDLHGLPQVLWPDHCVQGTTGADFSEALEQRQIEAIFRKGTDPEIDSYSGFYDNGHRKSTGLADYLRGKQVRQVFVAGLAADFCVYFSVQDALREGFKTFLMEDATRPINAEGFEKAKLEIHQRGGKIIQSGAIFS
ncbi:bifunctional nicotinamidase/pyrazinamidase [Adhaeribacter pallidiroseus]|uniref:Nicotinamidase n=1 Tax=Adhaeribacter pallidiroseus TaxID=2072847 RepID=A0A369QFS9_9BACT|nr:bifunctional nicotinamidase/pyrazinamidase [Adhaeribacter pallidiroseus]RDC63773.1 Pyrazinamidase/nicotinamidase [Adhaeribacter pallidiroseus]